MKTTPRLKFNQLSPELQNGVLITGTNVGFTEKELKTIVWYKVENNKVTAFSETIKSDVTK